MDSGSIDGTGDYLRKNEAKNEDILLIFQEKRLGMGAALKEAYLSVEQEIVCHYECDCPFDLKELLPAYELLTKDRFDFILGHRVGVRDHFIRVLYTLGYRFFIYLLFGVSYKSINFSFKVFKKDILDKIHLNSQAWFIDAELVIESSKNFRIHEIDIAYTKRENDDSTVRYSDVIEIMAEAIEYKLRG